VKRNLRQTKVEYFGVSALGDENVGGLDVSMNDPFSVCGVEGICDLDSQRQNQFGLHRSPSNTVLQSQPVQVLHRDECFAVLVINFVNRADIGVIQCRGSFGFALKAAEGLRVFGYVVGQELEGDEATELHILSLVDNTHPAAAQLLQNAVVRDGLADHPGDAWLSGCLILKTRHPPVNG
jgi:hypothetical protein